MKAKKQTTTKTPRRRGTSRNGSNGHHALPKPKGKKKLDEMTADELLLEAWQSLYAKRDRFISMWD
ncbi:MAG TPA: hypothetical protein VFZ34_33010 [Blastocatellia bacterium]|nr:hypothetical protein [Blastocatellia bacterium]